MLLNALIVDDEEYSRKSLYFLLQEHCPEVQVTGIARSAAEARQLLREKTFDIAFLDVAMPKENGFELLPDIQSHHIMVIFTTAYDQYALRALKASAVDYLLKPIDIGELMTAVEKARQWLALRSAQSNQNASGMAAVGEQETSSTSTRITLPNVHGFNIVDTADIVYIEADSNYSVFHLKNNGKIVISKPLKEFEDFLENHHFARIHKSVIVNLEYVKSYSHKNTLQVLLHDETALPVSRRRANDFQEKLRNFLKN